VTTSPMSPLKTSKVKGRNEDIRLLMESDRKILHDESSLTKIHMASQSLIESLEQSLAGDQAKPL